jgi:hypothetical protein
VWYCRRNIPGLSSAVSDIWMDVRRHKACRLYVRGRAISRRCDDNLFDLAWPAAAPFQADCYTSERNIRPIRSPHLLYPHLARLPAYARCTNVSSPRDFRSHSVSPSCDISCSIPHPGVPLSRDLAIFHIPFPSACLYIRPQGCKTISVRHLPHFLLHEESSYANPPPLLRGSTFRPGPASFVPRPVPICRLMARRPPSPLYSDDSRPLQLHITHIPPCEMIKLTR